ncbi:MAG: hypothetical protein JW855_03230 [Gammaproteobacteria bacterium]|nr:hypothetical protein [Gammaproteobacteria bacterium]
MTIRAKFIGAGHLKHEFPHSTCIVPISVGQEYHEGEKFEAAIDLINRSQFKTCTIMVCDLLQRHNLQIYDENLDDKTASEKMVQEGKAWLERNNEYINRLEIPHFVDTWDTWLKKKSIMSDEF